MRKFVNMVLAAMMVLALVGVAPVLADENNNCIEKEGAGWALLAGSGEVEFEGRAFIVVLGENPEIETNGNGTVRRITPEMTMYRGSGKIEIEGEKIVVYVRGAGRLEACGEGFTNLGGQGLA